MLTLNNPGGVPHFFYRSTVSSELFDFIVECCLSENSAAIAEHVKRTWFFFGWDSFKFVLMPVMSVELHLLEYHRSKLEYLQFYEA